MQKIVLIEGVEQKKNKQTGKTYWRTHAVLENGTEAVGWGKDFDLDDLVEYYYVPDWDEIQMKKKKRS